MPLSQISQVGRERLSIPNTHLDSGAPCTREGAQRTSLNHQTDKRMTLRPKTISGVFLGIIFTVITHN